MRFGLCLVVLCLSLGSVSKVWAADIEDVAQKLAACQQEKDAETRRALCASLADNSLMRDEVRAEALFQKGRALSEMGQHAASISVLTQAIALNAVYPAPYIARAQAFVMSGALEKALSDLSKSLALAPKSEAALSSRGAVYLLLDQPEKALADFQALIFLDPASAQGYAARGMALEAMGERTRAAVDYRKSLDIEASNERATRGLERLGGGS